MVKLGIVQTASYSSNQQAIKKTSQVIDLLGRNECDIVTFPEQWLQNNQVSDFEFEFKNFKSIARDYCMTVIPGAFYERQMHKVVISAPVIGPNGEIIGKQEKIHPFDYEQKVVTAGNEAKVFKTICKFGIIVCYDMVFPEVAYFLVRNGAEILVSPSRIVKRGIYPWHLYVQVRALENRIPILAANIENYRFGGKSIIVDLTENNGIVLPKIITNLKGEESKIREFNLKKYKKSRKIRFLDKRKFSQRTP